MKIAFWFGLRLRRLRSSEKQVVGVASRSGRSKPITKGGNVHCDWFIVPPLLPTPTVWFSLDRKRRSHKHKRKWKKMETFWFFRLRFRRCCDSTFMIPSPTPSNRTWIWLLLTPRDVPTFSAVVVIKVKTLSWLLSHRKTIALKVFEISVIITNSAIQDYNPSDGRKLWSYGGNVPRTNYVSNMKCSSLRLSTAENENGFIELFFSK